MKPYGEIRKNQVKDWMGRLKPYARNVENPKSDLLEALGVIFP